jgi:hypothetical protein
MSPGNPTGGNDLVVRTLINDVQPLLPFQARLLHPLYLLTMVVNPDFHALDFELLRSIFFRLHFGPRLKHLGMRTAVFLHGAEAAGGNHARQKGNIEDGLVKKQHDGRNGQQHTQKKALRWNFVSRENNELGPDEMIFVRRVVVVRRIGFDAQRTSRNFGSSGDTTPRKPCWFSSQCSRPFSHG